MITISFVTKTLIVALIISLIAIFFYNKKLKKDSYEPPSHLKNTDIFISSGIDEIKIICK